MARKLTDEEIQDYVSQFDCKLVSIERIENILYINLICKCGTHFRNRFYTFKIGKKQCSKCTRKFIAENQRIKYEDVKDFIEKAGYKLISKEYTNNKQLLQLICPNGHAYKVHFNAFKSGNRCSICAGVGKDTITYREQVKNIQNGEFEVLEEYQRVHIAIKHKHNKCGKEFKISPKNFIRNPSCPECRNWHRWTNESIKEQIFDMYNGEYELLEDFKTVEKHHLMHHKVCGNQYHVQIDAFLRGRRCPLCFGTIKKTPEQYRAEVEKVANDEYLVLGEYINSQTKILHKHIKCGNEFLMQPNSFLNGEQRCPKCRKSKGEKKITQWLDENNINYIPQYKFSDCRNKNPLPFDFAIFDENNHLYCLIEFDGEQHFMWRGHLMKYEDFLRVQYHDNLKNQYCEKNNIPLLRISYKNIKKISDILDIELNHLKNPYSEVI